MKTTKAKLIAPFTFVVARADNQRCLLTEASVTLNQTTGHHLIVAKLSELITDEAAEEPNITRGSFPVLGDIRMKLIAAPSVTVAAGESSSMTDMQSDGTSVRVDVFWPESGSDQPATLVITLKSQTKLLAWSIFSLDLNME
jgi:hypothetical protein